MLKPEQVERLVSMFEALGWAVKEAGRDSERFGTFLRLLTELDDEGRDLLLTITQDFYDHYLALYSRSSAELVAALAADHIPDNSLVVLLPLVKPEDIGQVKSHGAALYFLRNEVNDVAPAHNWRIRSWDRLGLVKDELPHRRNAFVVLADDFVGSGNTAEAAVTHFKQNYAVPSDRILVASLVAQDAAVRFLAARSITCVARYVRFKGISDSTRLTDKSAAMATMDLIESRLKIGPLYRHGYEGSEALVSLARCPNNTFPVYWAARQITGLEWPRLFRR